MDVKAILKRFLHLNGERMSRARATLRPIQQDVIDILPLLFHINHPELPGFVSHETPSGISNYMKEGQAILAARRLIRGFDYRRSVYRRYDISAMFLIGSSGTIAQSSKSDFDVWLCHASDLTDHQLEELREKGELIEKWADSFNMEVHFFLMDAERFKRGEVLDLSSESSGTAQHDLLLDEFYRTALWLAGNYPMWWLVPPDDEVNYDEYAANLLKKRFIEPGEVIDFGGLGNMPAEEFFGAAVWQIYKGVDSPYKSLLKILVMEIYATEYPKINFLSLMFKRAIYEDYCDEFNINHVDPYIMLINKLSSYLDNRENQERLELVRRCLYFKINMPLSKMRYQPGVNWQQDLLMKLTRDWGWRLADLRDLDSRNSWKIDTIGDERKILVKELTQSYFELSEFARANKAIMISQHDLNVLGRKLYAAFERKTGKLEIITRGFSSDLHESLIGISQSNLGNNRESWFMFRGNGFDSDISNTSPLKRASSAIELLCWGYFNKLINKRTAFAIKGQSSLLNDREVNSILSTLERNFPDGNIPPADIEDFSAKPKLLSVMLFVNVGKGSPPKMERVGHLITDKDDALSFSSMAENLILSIDAVFVTSWQEVLVFHFEGDEGFLECMTQYLQWSPLNENNQPPEPKVYSFSSNYNDKISNRVKHLFKSTCRSFYGPQSSTQNLRYTFALRKGFAMLYEDDGVIRYNIFNNCEQLKEELSSPRSRYSTVKIDTENRQPLLKLIYENSTPDVIQFYFYPKGKELDIYIIDEKGSLFQNTLPLIEPKLLLQHYNTFLNSIVKRQAATLDNSIGDQNKVVCFQIIESKNGSLRAESRDIRFSLPNQYYNVQVIGENVGGSEHVTVYCNDKEFSSLEYGENIFEEVANHILSLRTGKDDYPIYITDIDLPDSTLEVESNGAVQTLHYLNYKKRIEEQLNNTVQSKQVAL